MQDTKSTLAFVPMEGYVDSTIIAIEKPTEDAPDVLVDLKPTDPRLLAGGYPVRFEIPHGHDFSYFGKDGFSRGKATDKKKNLVACIVVDDSTENWWDAANWLADASTPCLVNGTWQGTCAIGEDVEGFQGVAYRYIDTIYIEAEVTGNSAAQAASADAGKHKAKKGGKHRSNGKHRN